MFFLFNPSNGCEEDLCPEETCTSIANELQKSVTLWTVYTCWLCGDRPQGAVQQQQQKKSFETFTLRIGADRQTDREGLDFKSIMAELVIAHLAHCHRKHDLDGSPAQLFSL